MRCRKALADEHVGEQSLGHALRERGDVGSSLDHLPESTAARPALGREPGGSVAELVERDEFATQRGVDVGVEHDRAQRPSEVEEGACRRGARDAVDLGRGRSSSMTRLSWTTSPPWRARAPTGTRDLDRRRCRPDGKRPELQQPIGARRAQLVPAAQQAASTSPCQVTGCTTHAVHVVVERLPASGARDARVGRRREYAEARSRCRAGEDAVMLRGESCESVIRVSAIAGFDDPMRPSRTLLVTGCVSWPRYTRVR